MSCQAFCKPNIDCEEIHSLLFHIPIYHNPRSAIANMPFGEQVLPPAHKRGPTRLPDSARSPRCDPVESLYLALYGVFSRSLVRWLLVSEQAYTYQYTRERP